MAVEWRQAISRASPCLLTPPQYQGTVTVRLQVSLTLGTGEKLPFQPQKMPKSNAGVLQDDCQTQQVAFHASKKGVIP